MIDTAPVLETFFANQRPSVKSALGLGKDYDVERWTRELRDAFLKAGMPPWMADQVALSKNQQIAHRLKNEPVPS
jgi:hypothetical protein